jgi:predicted MFS family arabinose efflux permease
LKPLPLIIILLILNHIAAYGGRLTTTLFAIDQHATPFIIGLLMALYALLPALLSVTTGRWIDRVGVEQPLKYGSIAVGIGTLLPYVWPSLTALYFTCVIVGMGFMLINVAAYHAVGEMSAPEERPVNFSYLALGFSTSNFISPILSGVAIDSFGHRTTFLVLALFTVLPIAALLLKLLPFSPPKPVTEDQPRGRVLDLLKDAELKRLFLTMTMITVAWDVYGFAVPLHGVNIGLSASEIGIVLGAFAAATFSVRLAMPFIAARIRPWTLLKLSLLIAGLSFACMPFTTHIGLLMVLMFALGLGLGAPQPMVLTILHESAPAGRTGEALGLRTTLINTSQTTMPMLFGAVGATFGLMPIFWAMAVLLVGGGLVTRQPPKPPNPH